LGEIVRRLSGQPLDEFARVHIFLPLGMRETRFRPPASLAARIAPTERVEGEVLRGVVHDPTARRMGGVAGHAGLFSTARDLARFADMMLARGAAPQTPHSPVLSPATVAAFTAPQSPPNQPLLRALGWDIDTQFSAPRGELFPLGSYGHTGFTGTSIWIDPLSRAYVILLANSVHPERRPAITSLRSRVATITAASLGIEFPGVLIAGYNQTLEGPGARRRTTRNAETLTGLDVLAAGGFAPLKGKRVGLLTNHTGIDRRGRPNLELLLEAGVQVAALFSPEHGFDGRQDHENIPHSSDPATGIRIFSLYQGNSRRPTPAMLRGLDVLVFDVQDIGVRFYTYISSLGYALEECARAGVAVYVLDRPNPLTGVRVEGPMLDPDNLSFTGYFPLPLRHGMTVGELALLFNSEKKLGANLTVIPMKNWQRGDWFDSSSLAWVNPSPNIRGLEAALLYPALALLEYSKNYSVGRGTDFPFEQIGASFIRGPELASYLNSRKIPGVRLYPVRFPHAGETVEGVRFLITDREVLDASLLGLEIAGALRKLFPGEIDLSTNVKLIGSREVLRRLDSGEDPRLLHHHARESLKSFLDIRRKYQLYPESAASARPPGA
ncbi:MAG: DUF1343 domain-containing protein, partial [Acidobacteria bacterium]|nr:DUF1343 domain-containing protein [Acidobacteriota bacterium]